MSVHLVLGVVFVAVGLVMALVAVAVVAGRVELTQAQRAARQVSTPAQRVMAARAIRRRLVVPDDEVEVVAAVARGRLSLEQPRLVVTFLVITFLCLASAGSGSPLWLQVASPAVVVANYAIVIVVAVRARRARRYLAATFSLDGPVVR